ncbi:toxin-antitoxin system YwqK family antitoxin [Sphingobacterium daejeonense]|uniref:toxin-antitoxin system YwqK family antitoxin n=1 Tax=Sphingobacterium daejeonense TaxID=371142 RepID=UPI003D314E1B
MRPLKFIIPIIILFSCSKNAFSQYQRSEYEKFLDIKNRITINHDDGRLESFYITDEKTNVRSEKFYYWYQSRKIQRTQGGFSGKLLHGSYQEFSGNKQLRRQGFYNKGLPHGEWKYWSDSQHLLKEEHWNKGKLNGLVSLYNEKGGLSMKGPMKDAQWNGKIQVLDTVVNDYQWKYYREGIEISAEEYIGQNIFRRTASFFNSLWYKVFLRDRTDKIPSSDDQEILPDIDSN